VTARGTVTVGVLHPGEMGSFVAAAARIGGAEVLWASAGRSAATRRRAAADGLADAGTAAELAAESDLILSVCPPHAAVEVARTVAARGFDGVFVDANAVAPATSQAIGALVEAGGARFVDGGIIGNPVRGDEAQPPRLYLSGPEVEVARVAARFDGSPLEALPVAGGPGAASALKLCYAAWTKGSAALLMAIRATAAAEGVDAALLAEWAYSQPDVPARSDRALRGTPRKAWRWVAEMEEIAATLEAAGLPGGFHQAAAEVYRRLERHKDATGQPAPGTVVADLLGAAGEPAPAGRRAPGPGSG
jgi:3-hydroxyisobutyrate dehydrogenase-like beta-hydroxyacid dehydrogenase